LSFQHQHETCNVIHVAMLFTPPCFSKGERKNSDIFDTFRATVGKFFLRDIERDLHMKI